MKKRTKISEEDGWRGKSIQYTMKGYDQNFYCNERDWRRYEITLQLVEAGVDESLLDELYELGYDEGTMDECDANAGAEL